MRLVDKIVHNPGTLWKTCSTTLFGRDGSFSIFITTGHFLAFSRAFLPILYRSLDRLFGGNVAKLPEIAPWFVTGVLTHQAGLPLAMIGLWPVAHR